jgi:hypothetical protein
MTEKIDRKRLEVGNQRLASLRPEPFSHSQGHQQTSGSFWTHVRRSQLQTVDTQAEFFTRRADPKAAPVR